MTTKTYLVEMPGDWVPSMCPDCHIQYSQCSGICGELKCALTNAKEVVEFRSGFDICWGESQAYDFHTRKPVKLYAMEVEK